MFLSREIYSAKGREKKRIPLKYLSLLEASDIAEFRLSVKQQSAGCN